MTYEPLIFGALFAFSLLAAAVLLHLAALHIVRRWAKEIDLQQEEAGNEGYIFVLKALVNLQWDL